MPAGLIALILMMGIMDLLRSERTLIGFMEDQGNRIIGVVERLTEENRVLSRKGEGTTFEILLPTERHNDKGAKSS